MVSYLRKIELILNHFLDSTVLNKINHLFHFLLMDLDESYLSPREIAFRLSQNKSADNASQIDIHYQPRPRYIPMTQNQF